MEPPPKKKKKRQKRKYEPEDWSRYTEVMDVGFRVLMDVQTFGLNEIGMGGRSQALAQMMRGGWITLQKRFFPCPLMVQECFLRVRSSLDKGDLPTPRKMFLEHVHYARFPQHESVHWALWRKHLEDPSNYPIDPRDFSNYASSLFYDEATWKEEQNRLQLKHPDINVGDYVRINPMLIHTRSKYNVLEVKTLSFVKEQAEEAKENGPRRGHAYVFEEDLGDEFMLSGTFVRKLLNFRDEDKDLYHYDPIHIGMEKIVFANYKWKGNRIQYELLAGRIRVGATSRWASAFGQPKTLHYPAFAAGMKNWDYGFGAVSFPTLPIDIQLMLGFLMSPDPDNKTSDPDTGRLIVLRNDSPPVGDLTFTNFMANLRSMDKAMGGNNEGFPVGGHLAPQWEKPEYYSTVVGYYSDGQFSGGRHGLVVPMHEMMKERLPFKYPWLGWEHVPFLDNFMHHFLSSEGRFRHYRDFVDFLTDYTDPYHVIWTAGDMNFDVVYIEHMKIVTRTDRWFHKDRNDFDATHVADPLKTQTRGFLSELHPHGVLMPLAPVYLHCYFNSDKPGVQTNYVPRTCWNSRAGVLFSGRMLGKTHKYYISNEDHTKDTRGKIGISYTTDEDGTTGYGPDFGLLFGATADYKDTGPNYKGHHTYEWTHDDNGQSNILKELVDKPVYQPDWFQKQCSERPHAFVGSNFMNWYIHDRINLTERPQYTRCWANDLHVRFAPNAWCCVHFFAYKVDCAGTPGFDGMLLQRQCLCSNPELLRRYLPLLSSKEFLDDSGALGKGRQSGGFEVLPDDIRDELFEVWQNNAYMNGPFVIKIPYLDGRVPVHQEEGDYGCVWLRANDLDPKRTPGLDAVHYQFDTVALRVLPVTAPEGEPVTTPEGKPERKKYRLIKHLETGDNWTDAKVPDQQPDGHGYGFGDKREHWIPAINDISHSGSTPYRMQGTFYWFYQTPGPRRTTPFLYGEEHFVSCTVNVLTEDGNTEERVVHNSDDVWKYRLESDLVYDFIPDGFPGIAGPSYWWFRFLAEPHRTPGTTPAYSRSLVYSKITSYLAHREINPLIYFRDDDDEPAQDPWERDVFERIKLKVKTNPYFAVTEQVVDYSEPISEFVFWTYFIPQYAFDKMGCTKRKFHELAYFANWYSDSKVFHSLVVKLKSASADEKASPSWRDTVSNFESEKIRLKKKYPDVYRNVHVNPTPLVQHFHPNDDRPHVPDRDVGIIMKTGDLQHGSIPTEENAGSQLVIV
jgi:hypothetical protein